MGGEKGIPAACAGIICCISQHGQKEAAMRGSLARLASVAIFLSLAVVEASAAGPQFTGLLNIYNPASSGFSETSNSLAQMTPGGPVAGTVVPLSRGWSDIVVNPNGSAYYTITSNE